MSRAPELKTHYKVPFERLGGLKGFDTRLARFAHPPPPPTLTQTHTPYCAL